jgi:glucuronoarabinoxylan endo-1,4-beta-xylanase
MKLNSIFLSTQKINFFVVVACCLLLVTVPTSADAQVVTLNKNQRYQTIDGFGFFGANSVWWQSADSNYYLDDQWMNLVLTDLGVTLWRNEYYPPEDSVWYRQKPFVEAFSKKAKSLGINLKFTFTIWSPPSTLKCDFGTDPAGNLVPFPSQPSTYGGKGGTLNPYKYKEFADWIKSGIQMYKDVGVDVYAISPQNEPYFVQPYNSCFYTQQWYVDMIKNVLPAVKTAYPQVKIFGAENMLGFEGDSNAWPYFYHGPISKDAKARDLIDIFAYHGYLDGVLANSGSILNKLWTTAYTKHAQPLGKKQWMTETSGYFETWGNTSGINGVIKPGALALAQDMYSALVYGNISGWIWWQGSEDAAAISEFCLMSPTQQRKKYYVSKQFFRYIRPEAVRVDATSSDQEIFVTAFDNTLDTTSTVVLINSASTSKNITLSTQGGIIVDDYNVYVTSATENCANKGTVNAKASITLPAQSVTTLYGRPTTKKRPTVLVPLKPVLGIYPNPTVNQLTVSYEVKGNEKVRIVLYDETGKLIAELFDGIKPSGNHQQQLNVGQYGAGVYFLDFSISNRVKTTKKIIVGRK